MASELTGILTLLLSATLPEKGKALDHTLRQTLFLEPRSRVRHILTLGFLVSLAMTAPTQAQKLSLLYNFKGSPNAANPRAGLVRDLSGNFYGTTAFGGKSDVFGTVFKLDKSNNETVLHSFKGNDGAFPLAALVMDVNGNLYGTTSSGGASSEGVVFKLSKNGTESTLHNFTGQGDGANPDSSLLRDKKGNLYGTTQAGGAFGGGVVFELTTAGNLIVLHSFCSQQACADGQGPVAGLVKDSAGNLYGTTQYGGSPACSGQYTGCGVVFKVTPAKKETVLYTFCSAKNCTDGTNPIGGVIRDSAGNFYGTTSFGGDPNASCGTVFELSPSPHRNRAIHLRRWNRRVRLPGKPAPRFEAQPLRHYGAWRLV